MQEIKAKSLLFGNPVWTKLPSRCRCIPPLREAAAVREVNPMTIKRSVIYLFLIFWAVVLASKPTNAAVLFQLQHIDGASDSSTQVVSLRQVSEPQSEQGTYVPSQSHEAVVIGQDALCFLPSVGAFRAKFCDYSYLTRSARLPSILLPASPAITDTIANKRPYRIGRRTIECDNDNHHLNFAADCFRENPTDENSLAFCCVFDHFLGMPAVLVPKYIDHGTGPSTGNALNRNSAIRGDGFRHDPLKNVSGIPTGDGIQWSGTTVADIIHRGEYDLVVECSNFALRVVWFGENGGGGVIPLAISGNDQFIFRQVKDDDSSMRGADLGACQLGSEQNEQQGKQTFTHLILSSGSSAIAGFTSGPDRLHTCFGCTVLVSEDARHWREITAIREALPDSKRDPSALIPSQE